MSTLGFVAFRTPPGAAMPDSCLMAMLRAAPTLRHFDPEAASFWVNDDAAGSLALVDRDTATPMTRRFSWGRFGWWVSLEHGVGVGASAALVIGVLILAYAAFAAYAARDEYLARPRAIVFGIIVAAVAVLASLVALLEGRSNEAENLLYIAGGLGIVTLVVVLLSARRMTSAMEA
jgi:hypothetical protein